ncbi:MAG: WD40/YVTN/BNR-like repeat-containing protein [Tepidiformaceae bacterium]
MTRLILLVGTRKGAFIVESDPARAKWDVRGPFCETWPVQHMSYDPATGNTYAAAGNAWFGPSVWRSPDLGATWTQSSAGLEYGPDEPAVELAWNVTPAHGVLYAGVAPAGLFRSDDNGDTWTHVKGLRDHPSRPGWEAGGGGLMVHGIVPHPSDRNSMWVAISAAGTFRTRDGGKTWVPLNHGVRADHLPGENPETGQCVHCLVMAPGSPSTLYQQNHFGVYRTTDAGESWQEISAGLPSTFGFPMAIHPRDDTTVFTIPLNGDSDGRYPPDASAAVWRTRDGGDTWHRLSQGLPQSGAYFGIFRQAMATDPLTPAGVYFGTTDGTLYGSNDEGESWQTIASHLPGVSSVAAVALDG